MQLSSVTLLQHSVFFLTQCFPRTEKHAELQVLLHSVELSHREEDRSGTVQRGLQSHVPAGGTAGRT